MKVNELIKILESMDPEAEVHIMSQRSWPFENSLHGVRQRSDFEDEDEDEDEDAHRGLGAPAKLGSDVFLVTGSQIRHGNKNAWN